jgi:two-component system OmpR family response regulator
MKLLVVEDDTELASALISRLSREGYAVDMAFDGKEAIKLIEINEYDLAVLDMNLPLLDGSEVLRYIRAAKPRLRVLVLTARDALGDRVGSLDMGADDYLTKPFHFEELLARLRALLRRDLNARESVLCSGDLRLDPASKEVWQGEDKLRLTRKEFSILEYLMRFPGEVITQEQLLEHVWGNEADPFTGVVRVHINSLRRKLKDSAATPRYIETVPAQGYRLKTQRNGGSQ